MIYRYVESPFGSMILAGDGASLAWLAFTRGPKALAPPPGWTEDRGDALLREVESQLDAYFHGRRRRFDVPLNPRGTAFQKRVWDELVTIPYGTTVSYTELARRVERPGAFRAVGAANGQNPISVLVPCHRVLGKDGHLTGYGGGLDTKRGLLELERRYRETDAARAATKEKEAS